MEDEILKSIAMQLRKPQGEFALQVGDKMNESNAEMNLSVIDKLNLKVNEQVLEIGMANGFFVKHLFECYPDIQYTGCDYSEIMVAEAVTANLELIQNKQAAFYHASADKMPFENAIFDTIFTINTLYFWDNPQQVLNEISRILKPEGKIVIAIRPKEIMEHLPFVKYDFTTYNADDVIDLLSENGYRINEIFEIDEPKQEVQGEEFPLAHSIIIAEKK